MKTISDHYKEQNRLFHEEEKKRGKPWGVSGRKYIKEARSFAKEIGAKTILDYGCGSCTLGRGLYDEFDIREYDPAIPEKENGRTPSDLVVNTDVMEHVEPEYIDNALLDIYGLAQKGCFFAIATVGCHEWLPDGTNAHLTVKGGKWWLDRFHKLNIPIDRYVIEQKKVKIWIKKP